jgi:hypothetical protein
MISAATGALISTIVLDEDILISFKSVQGLIIYSFYVYWVYYRDYLQFGHAAILEKKLNIILLRSINLEFTTKALVAQEY